ncbi:hypothetical protein Tco_0637044 [Tanacetum coccineum]
MTKLVKDQSVVNDADEGFVEVKKKKHKNKNKQHKVAGVRLTKPQPQLLYRRVDKGETSQKVHTDKAPIVTQAPEFIVKNSFGPYTKNEGDVFHDESLKHDDVLNVSDSEVDEEFQVDRNGNNRPALCLMWILQCETFRDVVEDIEMLDCQSTGLRVMGAHAMFKPYRVSDHNASVLCIPTLAILDVVKTEWDHYISGFFMFRVVKKLKNLKKPLRKLLYDKGNVHANREATYVIKFNEAELTEKFIKDKKPNPYGFKEGDANSAYFHKAVKSRVSRSRIDTVTNSEGVVFDNNTVHDAFVTHYEMFLGHEGETSNFNYANLFNVRINDQDAQDMVPDGFTAAFFKEAWNIIANDVYLAVREFFRNGTLLKEINHTIIALLPKVKSPSRVNDYRPISCCNVLVNGSSSKEIRYRRIYILCDGVSYINASKGKVQQTDEFTYHRYCSKMELVNLCFADDLFLFAYGDVGSASIIKEALDEFKNASGLVPSLPKSTAYFCNVS